MPWRLETALGLVLGVALALAAFYLALPWILGPMFRVLLAPRYRFRVRGLEKVPASGPVLLAANHVTWIDGFLVAAVCPRRGYCLVNADFISRPIIRVLARRAGVIPVPASGPRAQRAAIEAMRAALDRGEMVGLFPEGQLTRNGLLGPFYRGLEVILSGREQVPVIPVYIDNMWGSIFSYSGGRTLRKRPKGLRRTVIIAFGPPVPPPVTAFAVHQAVLATAVRAVELRDGSTEPLEALDPSLPRFEHPGLGLLAASAPDFERDGIRQVGQKPGTLGHAVPGVALRAVDDAGQPLPADAEGRLQALLPGRPDWVETGFRGSLDRDGFVRVVEQADPAG